MKRAEEAHDQVQEADCVRASALGEAVFYHAKLVALEAWSESEVAGFESERTVDLERHLQVSCRCQEIDDLLSLLATSSIEPRPASKRADALTQSVDRNPEAHNAPRECHAVLKVRLRRPPTSLRKPR